ncbi:hypothetical protein AB0K00_15310 [Dactylosporangium sp. NPDC049525]|uniref:hypothetical protein n=1 Tax=Dactylosporangium sp. NPDC049525 TaxID=3154730 RepID=UPI003420CF27
MDWGTLAATALGGPLGAGGTVVVDQLRWRRDHGARERSGTRELYGTDAEWDASIAAVRAAIEALKSATRASLAGNPRR